jgi:GT2 family glycosyltransferase
MLPPISVLWLNYNSMHMIDVTKKSLDAVFGLDYPDLEIILADNNSSDGSRDVIEKYFLEKQKNRNVKFAKLKKNWGPSGANNIAYNMRRSNSKYAALTHNDLIPNADYLRKIIPFLENHKNVGVAQGIVSKLGNESIVDSSGFMMNEALALTALYSGCSVTKLSKPMYVSMVEGTMPVYNLEAVKNALGTANELYVTAGFMYYLEDAFESLKLWTKGYKCVVLPIVMGAHYRMGTSKTAAKQQDLFHYLLRNRIALLMMTNSASKLGFITQNIRKLIISNRTSGERKAILIALIAGIRLGRKLKRKYGSINLYSAPLVRERMNTRLFQWLH